VDTETVAVITSSIVALAAIGAGWLQYRGGLTHERELADLDNIRGVLDDAAALIHRVAYVLDDVRLGLLQHGRKFFESEQRVETHRKLERCGQEGDALIARLEGRLGPDHEAVKTFTQANEAVLDIYRALGLIRLESDPPPDPSAAAQVATIVDEQRDRIIQSRTAFDDRRRAFTDAAYRTTGVRLPAKAH